MERLFEFGIVIVMSLFAIRVGSEGMRRLEAGEKVNALTIFSLTAALLVVQVPIVISILRSTPVVAQAQAGQNSAIGTNVNPSGEPAKRHPRHRSH
jgi:hypothetical protein